MMTQFPQDDEKLVAFLRQHCPVPPPARRSLEQQLMALVEGKAVRQKRPIPWWFLPSACAAGLLLAWGVSSSLAPQPQLAASPEELERFLIENWQGVLGETPSTYRAQTAGVDWLILANYEANSLVYQP